MYDIYIKHYMNPDGTQIDSEQLLYSIPMVNSLNAVKDPVVKTEFGKAGSLEFSLHPKHMYFNGLYQMKTLFRVVYDGDTIFRGRVLTLDDTLAGEKKVHCEGDLAFLLDSVQEGVPEKNRNSIDILTYLNQVITAHNLQMAEDDTTDKQFTLGEVPGQYSDNVSEAQKVVCEDRKYGSDSWETTMSALEAVQKEFGGYFRTRYVDGVCYLDWLDNWFTPEVNTQVIEVGENLISMSCSSEVDNIFTALIPIGSKDGNNLYISGYKTEVHGEGRRILVPQIVSEFTDEELNQGFHKKSDYETAIEKYGIIYKTQSFQNADTQEKLWNYAIDWIRINYAGGLTSFDIGALDLHHVNGEIPKYLTGDRLTIRYPTWNKYERKREIVESTMALTAASYNLHNPEKNNYSVGIPNSILNKTYGTASNTTKKGQSGQKPKPPDSGDEQDPVVKDMKAIAEAYILTEKENSPMYASFREKYANDPLTKNLLPSAITTSAVILETALENDEHDVEDITSMVIDFTQPWKTDPFRAMVHDKQTEIYKKIGNPQMRKIIAANEEYQKQVTWLTIGAAQHYYTDTGDGIKLFGRKVDAPDSISTALNGITFTGDESFEEMQEQVTSALTGDGMPSAIPVAGILSNSDNPTGPFSTSFFGNENGTNVQISSQDEGTANIGKNATTNEWQIKLNDTVSYVDVDGNEQVMSGFVSAQDFTIPGSIDSFSTKLAVVDRLVANKAEISELEAAVARIASLEADFIKANEIKAKIGEIDEVVVRSFSCKGTFKYSDRYLYWMQIKALQDVHTEAPNLYTAGPYTFITKDGQEVTGSLVQSFSRGYTTPTYATLHYIGNAY